MTAGAVGRLRVPAYLALTVPIALGALGLGWAVSGQHYKVSIVLLLVPTIGVLAFLGRSGRFWLLLVAAALVPLQTPSLVPYGLSVSELLLLGLIAVQWTPTVSRRLGRGLGMLIPVMLFSALGLLAAYVHAELTSGQVVCVTPLLWFLAAAAFVRGPRDALAVQIACILSVVLYVAIVRLASALGYGGTVMAVPAGAEYESRLGIAGWALDVGPVSVLFWSTWLASLVGVAMPGAALLFVRAKGHALARYSWLAILALFVTTLVLSAGRGGVLAAAIGTAVALLASGRFSLRSVPVVAAGLLVFGMALQSILAKAALSVLPGANLSRIATLLAAGKDSNVQYRLSVLQDTIANVVQAPLGRGFNYWYNRGVDDPIVYAMLLNGVGVLGFLAFVALIAVLFVTYVRRLARVTGTARDAVAVALGTLVAATVAGFSSHSVWIAPVHTFLLWGICMSTYWGVIRARRSE